MIRDELGEITARGQTLIEASSGNTAKALQVLAAMHGVRLRAVTNRIKVDEVRDLLQLLGTEMEELPGLSECPDPTVPNDVYSGIEKLMAKRPGESTTSVAVHQPGEHRHPPRHHGRRSRGPRRGRLPVRRPGHHRIDPRRRHLPAGAQPGAAHHRRGVHAGGLHPGHPLRDRDVGGGPVPARLLHAIMPVRSATRSTPGWSWPAGTACWPGPPAAPPTGRRGSTCGGDPPPAGPPVARHDRLRPARAVSVLYPSSAAPTCSGRRAGQPGRCAGRAVAAAPELSPAELAAGHRPGLLCVDTRGAWPTGSGTCPAR